MFWKILVFILILNQGPNGVESQSLSPEVQEKLKSIAQWLDSRKDSSIFDYIYRINHGVGLNLLQGDIKEKAKKNPNQRTSITNHDQLWNTRVVPYLIDSSFDSDARKDILAAIDEYHQKTCIRWVLRTHEDDYVHFKKISGCYSNIGRTGGEQDISLMGPCLKKGTAVHEMMHALGFWHEQSRPDRDSWVHIISSNIQDGKEFNFKRLDKNEADTLGVRYDYGSVMHYSKYAFTKNGNPTIMPTHPASASIGQRDGLSDLDVERITTLYGCNYQMPSQTTTKYVQTKPSETKAPWTIPPLTKKTTPPVTNPPQTVPPVTNPPKTNPPVTNLPKTNPPATNPPVTHPPQTNPPQTNPPQTNPPVTNPPQTNPPVTNPPQTNPPVTNPPQTNPPVTNPPQTNPPVTKPPMTNPPITNPPSTTPGPVYHPGWTMWSEWSPCDLRCKHSRYRFCTNYDRNYCLGENTQVNDCPYPCKPAYTFGCWKQEEKNLTIPSAEGLAPTLMGSYKGRKDSLQECSNYAAAMGYPMFAVFNGGQCLTGPDVLKQFNNLGASNKCSYTGVGSPESMNVFSFESNIDGQWSLWTGWSRCTKTCGLGRQYRYRRCDNPPPIGMGASCPGADREELICNQATCITPIKCGSRYYAGGPGTSGVIWMRDYENFMECEYEIETGDPFSSISLYIHEIDIEYSRGCIYDTLMLFDGYNSRAPLVGTFCGSTPPGTFESTSNHVFLKFTSDETKTGRGFTVFYTINSRSRKACVKPPPAAHATISLQGNMVGDRAWYSCCEGYRMVGHSPIACVDQPGFALWDDKFPRCVYIKNRGAAMGVGTMCTFEDSICGFKNEPDSGITWNVKRPHFDSGNTSSRGNVLHAESNILHETGANARIRSGILSSVAMEYCLRFAYKIDGDALASFNVFLTNFNTDLAEKGNSTVDLVMEDIGQNKNEWINMALNINTARTFQIIFDAVLGDRVGNAVSIDDVIVTKGHCTVI